MAYDVFISYRRQGGDVDYQYGVGSLYAGGLGVPRDSAAAFRWVERAAQNFGVIHSRCNK